MKRANKLYLGGFLGAVAVILSGAALIKGGFYVGKHEGDTLHLLQMVLRMADGDWPHLDFHTPIGVLATAPIVLFVKAGLGVGMAILAAQVLVAALLFPAIWYVAWSRFSGLWSWLFGAIVLVLVLALVHGETDTSVSISMHYNRWAWAVTFLIVPMAMIRDSARPWVDGAIIGMGFAILALIKVTYFVGLAPAVLVLLLGRKEGQVLVAAVVSGLALAVLVTLLAGPAFWAAYLSDLLTVRTSTFRAQPGLPFGMVVGAPAYMAGSLMGVLAVVWLRQSGRALEGLAMLLLVVGFFYITFQNFANDPQWLGLLGLLLWQLAPEREVVNTRGWSLREATRMTALAALALATPSLTNLAYSPFRHLRVDTARFTPMLPGSGRHEDLQTMRVRAGQINAQVPLDLPGTAFAAFTDPSYRDDDRASFQGEDLPICNMQLGAVPWYSAMAADLKASGLSKGKTVFAADVLSAYWLYGAFEPLPGASPWYYGGLPGWENADYLIVPLCPMAGKVRRLILDDITARGETLEEIRRNEMYILYAR